MDKGSVPALTSSVKEPGWPLGNRPTPRKAWVLWKMGDLMECESTRTRSAKQIEKP